ncbi:MAG: hypothetical protein LBD41_05755 [Clostridiales Family XIII bacterium]|jgi:hypothetical protein|nr:hypothetical protein [Clostridiales Family XIII bacterium]
MDDIEKQILISKKIADFFSEQLKTDSDNRFALIGLAHSSMNVYTFSTRALKDENIALESKIMDYKKKSYRYFRTTDGNRPGLFSELFSSSFFLFEFRAL